MVDATSVVTAVHQNHDYSHVPGGLHQLYYGEEERRNDKLAGGFGCRYRIEEATHKLLATGLRRTGPATSGPNFDGGELG
jgi:hypothetical protein